MKKPLAAALAAAALCAALVGCGVQSAQPESEQAPQAGQSVSEYAHFGATADLDGDGAQEQIYREGAYLVIGRGGTVAHSAPLFAPIGDKDAFFVVKNQQGECFVLLNSALGSLRPGNDITEPLLVFSPELEYTTALWVRSMLFYRFGQDNSLTLVDQVDFQYGERLNRETGALWREPEHVSVNGEDGDDNDLVALLEKYGLSMYDELLFRCDFRQAPGANGAEESGLWESVAQQG